MFLKWAGSKKALVGKLVQESPEKINNYYEPFLGSGALYFKLKKLNKIEKSSFLSDISAPLIHTFRHIRDKHEEITERLKNLSEYNFKDIYYEIRDKYNDSFVDSIDNAVFFIYLNRTCYNGLYRENLSGGFNTPIGKYTNPTICQEDNIKESSKLLKKSRLRVCGFEQLFNVSFAENDFVYLDPPYYPTSKTSNFTEYSSKGFLLQDNLLLFDLFNYLTSINIKCMISNSNCDWNLETYKNYNIIEVDSKNSINSNSSKRKNRKEILIKNY